MNIGSCIIIYLFNCIKKCLIDIKNFKIMVSGSICSECSDSVVKKLFITVWSNVTKVSCRRSKKKL